MAAPEYVPRPADEKPRLYESPPWSGDSWVNDRPGDFTGRQPLGPRLGYPGPDQGYVLKLVRSFQDKVHLHPGERWEDVEAGCCAVALKRASLFGRAPVVHDLSVAFGVWGFLNESPDPDLVRTRRPIFEECSALHHYMQLRRVADLVPVSVLQMPHTQVLQIASTPGGWKQFFKRRGDSPSSTQAAPAAAAALAERARRAIEAES
ncbi:MAG: hypothetical protein R2726_06670 [Acidimicrobiales bacterium]